MFIKEIELHNFGKFNHFLVKDLKEQFYSVEGYANKSNGAGKTTLLRSIVYCISNTIPDFTVSKEMLINHNKTAAKIRVLLNNGVEIVNVRSRYPGQNDYRIIENGVEVNIRNTKDLLQYVHSKYNFLDVPSYNWYRKFIDLSYNEKILLLINLFVNIDFDKAYAEVYNMVKEYDQKIRELEKLETVNKEFKSQLHHMEIEIKKIEKKLNNLKAPPQNLKIKESITLVKHLLTHPEIKTCPVCCNKISPQNLRKLEKQYNLFSEYVSLLKELDEKKIQYDYLLNSHNNLSFDAKKLEDMKKHHYALDILKDYFVVSSSIFRKEILLHILEIINPAVNAILTKFFDMPEVELLEDMTFNTDRLLSKGEQQIYNMILFLVMFDFYKKQHKTYLNTLFIDEFIDVLDDDNINRMLSIFKEYSGNTQIFITTPKPLQLTEDSKIIINANE